MPEVLLDDFFGALAESGLYSDDLVEQIQNRLISYHKNKPWLDFAEVIGEVTQSVEDVIAELITLRFLQTADGELLKQYAGIVGEESAGWDDEDLRRLIRARILTYVSEGTIDEIIEIVEILTEASSVRYGPRYPAGYTILFDREIALDPTFLARVGMQTVEVTPAGVGVIVAEALAPLYFAWDGDPSPYAGSWGDPWLILAVHDT